MQVLRQRGKPLRNKTSFRPYEAVEEFKYLGTTINSRSVITPALQALKKRTNLCMHTIHKLFPNMVDMATRLDIFGVYIQPHFIGCLATLAFAPKTTVTAFCTHFMATLKKVAGLPNHTKVRKLLIAINKIHPFDEIHKSCLTKKRTRTTQTKRKTKENPTIVTNSYI